MAVIITNKTLGVRKMALSPKVRLLAFEGTIRSSKTVSAIQCFMDHLHDSDQELHLIAGADLDAIRDNLLDGDMGILKNYPEAKLRKDKIGSYYLEVSSFLSVRDERGKIVEWSPMLKKVLLSGYTSKDKWKKILGKTFDTILVDEVNVASKQFIDECFARQVSVDNPLTIWTLNGDTPEHYIYTDYINRCKYLDTLPTPASIRADMDKVQKEPGWYYIHWNMGDNPVMTADKIERAKSMYPVGSYYYKIKILGERGAPGRLIYLDYLKDSLIVDEKELEESREYMYFTVGVDIAETKAKNVFVLLGWKDNYSQCCVFDIDIFSTTSGYAEKRARLEAFIKQHKQTKYIECIAIDSAEGNFIMDMRGHLKALQIPVRPSNKATIKERIDMNIVALSTGRLKFSSKCKRVYDAFASAKWVEGKEGEIREDDNQELNDILDATEYAQTVHMHSFMRNRYMDLR